MLHLHILYATLIVLHHVNLCDVILVFVDGFLTVLLDHIEVIVVLKLLLLHLHIFVVI